MCNDDKEKMINYLLAETTEADLLYMLLLLPIEGRTQTSFVFFLHPITVWKNAFFDNDLFLFSANHAARKCTNLFN